MSILDKINNTKLEEVTKLKEIISKDADHPINAILNGGERPHLRRFESALRNHSNQFSNLAVISEIKRKSPSAGSIGEIADPTLLAKIYEDAGAACISCLTDETYFGGSMDDLFAVCKTVSIPVLRKDFVVDPVQIAEAIVAGASCVLLIVASLKEKTKEFFEICEKWGVCALVECHDAEEVQIAVDSGARLIGVNNRNLHKFEVSLQTSVDLLPLIPPHCVSISESGILTPADASVVRRAGYNACLVGQALVESPDTPALLRGIRGFSLNPSVPNCRKPVVKICGVQSEEDVLVAATAGADIVGIVRAEASPRYVAETEAVVELITQADKRGSEAWLVYATTVEWDVVLADLESIKNLSPLAPHGIQVPVRLLENAEEFIAANIPQETRLAFYTAGATTEEVADAITRFPRSAERTGRDCLLLDGATPGSGEAVEWDLDVIRALEQKWEEAQVEGEERDDSGLIPVILAGGLNPETVEAVVRANVRGFVVGVDVSSGVEVERGVKDAELVRAFVNNARQGAEPLPEPVAPSKGFFSCFGC